MSTSLDTPHEKADQPQGPYVDNHFWIKSSTAFAGYDLMAPPREVACFDAFATHDAAVRAVAALNKQAMDLQNAAHARGLDEGFALQRGVVEALRQLVIQADYWSNRVQDFGLEEAVCIAKAALAAIDEVAKKSNTKTTTE